MKLRKARQILKTFADDTRLRIINLLNERELAVNEICTLLDKTQPNVSKHLTRLRLTGIVGDRRDGLNVYYYLVKPSNKTHEELLNVITGGLSEIEVFKKDIETLNIFYKKDTSHKKKKK